MYRVYGKLKKDKRFKAFDMENNIFVLNSIQASIFTSTQLEALTREIDFMNSANEEFEFEIREIKE